jgi:hypothetical protein
MQNKESYIAFEKHNEKHNLSTLKHQLVKLQELQASSSQLVADAAPLLKFQFAPFDWGVSCITLNGAIAACKASIADIENKLQ